MQFILGETVLVLADKFDGQTKNAIKVCNPDRNNTTHGFDALMADKEIRTIQTRIVAQSKYNDKIFLVEILPEHHLRSWDFVKRHEQGYICLDANMIGKEVWCITDDDMGKLESLPLTLKSSSVSPAGQTCISCREFQIYAEPNLKSGDFACWSCRNDPRTEQLELR